MDTLITVMLCIEVMVLGGIVTYVNYRKLDELESYFSENEVVQRNKRFWSGKMPYDKMMRMALLGSLFMIPGAYIRDGEMTEEEFNSVPSHLKRWVLWPDYLGIQWLVCAGLWYCLKP